MSLQVRAHDKPIPARPPANIRGRAVLISNRKYSRGARWPVSYENNRQSGSLSPRERAAVRVSSLTALPSQPREKGPG